MKHITCQQLRADLQNIKELKRQFDISISSGKNLSNIENLQKQQRFLESKIHDLEMEFWNIERIKTFEKQYYDQLNILEKLGICSKEQPFIIDINDERHDLPSFEDIKASLNLKVIKKIQKLKEPVLLLTPFGLKLRDLVKKLKEKLPDLISTQDFILNDLSDLNRLDCLALDNWTEALDEEKVFAYFPDNFDQEKHGGKTKSEYIKQEGGWLISIVDGVNNLKKSKGKKSLKELKENSFRTIKNNDNHGLTPEEYIILSIFKLKNGQIMDINIHTILHGVILTGLKGILTGWRGQHSGRLYVDWKDYSKITNSSNSRSSIHLKVYKAKN